MGAADEIKKGLTKNLTNFTKQRKAEKKHVSAVRWRTSRMTEVRGKFLTEAANEVMKECYMKASDNNRLPATARQIFYVARPLIEERTDKPLSYAYFSQTLLPKYINDHGEDWDVVYDDRGHFLEPHSSRVIGLGTLNVRDYLRRVQRLRFEEADFDPASVQTCGPNGSFGAVLYVEKEGFLPLFKRVKLAKRYDLAIMSSKGMSVTAARKLADRLAGEWGVPLMVLHDFDKAGFSILGTFMRRETRRYTFEHEIKPIDLGMRLADTVGLQDEVVHDRGDEESRIANLTQNGATAKEIKFLLERRVELNAMTSRQLVAFVERKLVQHGIRKIVPPRAELNEAFRLFTQSHEAEKIIQRELKKLNGRSPVSVPRDLAERVRKFLRNNPTKRWDEAVSALVR